jgi:hypothetical protein
MEPIQVIEQSDTKLFFYDTHIDPQDNLVWPEPCLIRNYAGKCIGAANLYVGFAGFIEVEMCIDYHTPERFQLESVENTVKFTPICSKRADGNLNLEYILLS